jgi:phage gp29-like protein
MQQVRTSKIVDANGKPIQVREALSEEQTSRLGFIAKEFENHPSSGLTPRKLTNILQTAEHGNIIDQADLFEDMEEKDAHLQADLSKRKRAILDLAWDLKPPRNATTQEESQVEEVKEWIEDMEDFEDHLFDMGDAIGKGFSNLALNWQDIGKLKLPKLEHQPYRYFTIDEDDRNKILLRSENGKGEELWPFGWLTHVHKSKSGYVARGGLHRTLVWPYLFKMYALRDLAEFLEIYGIPMRLGTYPAGASDTEKRTLMNAVVGIGHNAAGIMPEGMAIEFVEAAKGQSDPYQFMLHWCESVQSKAILGGTLTSTAENTGLGSNLGDVHNEIRKDLLASDARQFAGTLTRDLIWPMIAINKPGADPLRAPRFKFITDEDEELNERADRDKTLFDMGYRLTEEKVAEVYGEGYERVEPKPNNQPEPNKAALAAAKAGDDNTELDGATDQLGGLTQPVIDQLYDRIKQLLNEVKTLEEFQDRLVEAFNFLDPDELVDVMQLGLALSELAGRYEVQENDRL